MTWVPLLVYLLVLRVKGDLLAVDVSGRSMEPSLHAGDRLLCDRSMRPWVGAVVVRAVRYSDSASTYQVKRLTALPGDFTRGRTLEPGVVWLEGDNASESSDSRQFGPVPRREVLAVAVACLRGARLTDLRFP